MRATEIEAIGELIGEALDAGGQLAQETHEAIARRTFAALGSVGRPVQVIHDGIAGATYRGVRTALRAGGSHGGRALAARIPDDAPALTTSVGGSIAMGVLNGFWGDTLAERESPLALELELRVDGQPVEHTPSALAAAFPVATGRLAVFIHGLCETDEAWLGLPPRGGAPARVPFPNRLTADLGYTPLMVRFNSGLHISDNGRALSRLLASVTEHWPVAVQEITLVGHSMGGLVARSACHYAGDHGPADAARPGDAAMPDDPAAHQPGSGWAHLLRHVFCLGTPHHGADLEKGVHLLDWALGQAPESRVFSRALRLRSAGIKDLRFGSVAEEDWQDRDPDEFFRDRRAEIDFLPNANYYFVGATLNPKALGHLLGDLLVRGPSAAGISRARRIPFEIDNGASLQGLSHFDLLTHPDVYDQLRAWLERPTPKTITAAP